MCIVLLMRLLSSFAYPRLAVVREDGIFLHDWGLIPSWVRNLLTANDLRTKTLNAEGEAVFEKPTFRESIAQQRCLLPVSGFYERREVNGVKYPYYIQHKEQDYFSLRSLYDTSINKDTGEIRNTFRIITTPANALMEKIHNLKKRMPLILSPENEMKWLEPGQRPEEKKKIKVYPEAGMKAYAISRDANNAHQNRDVPEIMKKVMYPGLADV